MSQIISHIVALQLCWLAAVGVGEGEGGGRRIKPRGIQFSVVNGRRWWKGVGNKN